ncbi:hypothetical protein Fmac_008905 [Flemingia macrophylla]|uniref:Uncharacterized protein n=1 Tax=Flemingia macrophylla TaxID=520843 RepID=A0ABD1MYQ5_9FABA
MHSCSMEVKVCWVRVAEVDEEEVDVVGVRVYFEEVVFDLGLMGSEGWGGSGSGGKRVLGIASDVAASALIGASNVFESTGSQPTPSIYKGISSTGVPHVSKKSKQKKTKSVVLHAHNAVISAMKPRINWVDMHIELWLGESPLRVPIALQRLQSFLRNFESLEGIRNSPPLVRMNSLTCSIRYRPTRRGQQAGVE